MRCEARDAWRFLRRAALALTLAVAGSSVVASPALASELIDRDAQNVRLLVNNRGEALLIYRKGGVERHVLVWGAINAIPPAADAKQVAFQVDYQGGWGKYYLGDPRVKKLRRELQKLRASGKPYLGSPVVKELAARAAYAKNYWRDSFKGSCPAYTGPRLDWFVTACTAPDKSHWAVQTWQRQLPNFGLRPNKTQNVWELRLSHWTGELPLLEVTMDWSWRKWHHLYGRLTYQGRAVHGFASTPKGEPLDTFGRNIYFDTFDSTYGSGWRRENSFLTHRPTGVFCYSINPHPPHPAGTGSRYRATVIGPGVTPDVSWVGDAPGAYDRKLDEEHNAAIARLGDKLCRPN